MKIPVKNSVGTTGSPESLEDYFQKIYNTPVQSSATCPSCGLKMYRQPRNHDKEDGAEMVLAHVEPILFPFSILKYAIPMCKKCNSQKENLNHFSADISFLWYVGPKFHLFGKHQNQHQQSNL